MNIKRQKSAKVVVRQLVVQVPREKSARVLEVAREHKATNVHCVEAQGAEGPLAVVTMNLSNPKLEAALASLEGIEEMRATFFPTGVIALRPPAGDAPDQVKDVGFRSPIEIYLGGLQSIGSWRGFLSYAALAGVVVWIGLFTGTVYLLTAAMLIAPFAGPAMNLALGTARGDGRLIRQTVLRYFAALAVAIGVAFLLTLVLGPERANNEMVARSQLSSVAVLLPIAAGLAGALNLVQSERSSLVSGAATGLLVAASLAPPAGVVGMAAAIGRWDLVQTAGFVVILQLVGINFAGASLFRAIGLGPKGARYDRGKVGVSWLAWGVTAALLAGLLFAQFRDVPGFQRASRADRALAVVEEALRSSGTVDVVRLEADYPRPTGVSKEVLLVQGHVLRRPEVDVTDSELRETLSQQVRQRLREAGHEARPLVDLTVLP